MGFSERLSAGLAERKQAGLYRQRYQLDGAQGATVQYRGNTVSNFSSNDYLGLANHPEMVKAFIAATESCGVGSGASHLVCGHSVYHHELEERLAALTGRPSALLFSSGYMANLGVLTSLLSRNDSVYEDKLNHASLLDGGLSSGARFQRFLHNDLADLERRLIRDSGKSASNETQGNRLVVVDGVFSMDGDSAPLTELSTLCKQYDSWLMVDDAHGFGVRGADGAGSVSETRLGL